MGERHLIGGIICEDPEVDFISTGGDVVVDYDAVIEVIT
jgi:hypothetical protein